MRAGPLVAAAVVVVVGAVGAGIGYAAGGSSSVPSVALSPAPLAASPSVPVTLPSPYAKDIDYPSLTLPSSWRTETATLGTTAWTYPVPAKWLHAHAHNGDPAQLRRYRPPTEPLAGGYGLQIQPISSTRTPAQQVRYQLAHLPSGATVERHSASRVFYDYRQASTNLRRYQYMAWVAGPGGKAGLAITVVGRAQDAAGMNLLLAAVAAQVTPHAVHAPVSTYHPPSNPPHHAGGSTSSPSKSPSDGGSPSAGTTPTGTPTGTTTDTPPADPGDTDTAPGDAASP